MLEAKDTEVLAGAHRSCGRDEKGSGQSVHRIYCSRTLVIIMETCGRV